MAGRPARAICLTPRFGRSSIRRFPISNVRFRSIATLVSPPNYWRTGLTLRRLHLVIPLCILVAACSNGGHSAGQSGAQTARLRATLSSLNLKDPGADAKARVAQGDLRPVGIYGFTCSIPGQENSLPSPRVGIRCLDGTSDAAESEKHGRLIKVAEDYALTYDRELKRITAK